MTIRSIKHKLFMLFALQALVVIAAVTGIVAWSFDRGFLQYVVSNDLQRTRQLAVQLESIYVETGSWDALTKDRRRWIQLVLGVTGHELSSDQQERLYDMFPASSFPIGMPAPLPLRYALLDARQTLLLGAPPDGPGRQIYPIGDPDTPTGYIAINPSKTSFSNLYDVTFRKQFTAGIVAAALGAVLLALMLALGVSRRFLRPVSEVTDAARQLAAGNYRLRLEANSEDELGRLGRDINELATALERHEELQRYWIADISHELRTPVSLLLARLEAMQDGVRPVDRHAVDALHADVTRLSHMIEDLYTLSLSDTGALECRKRPVDLGSVAACALELLGDEFAAARLVTELRLDRGSPLVVFADPDRLHQMLVNLLTNSARYTDPEGRVRVSVYVESDTVAVIEVEDSPPAVAEGDLQRIFDRLYRTDESRNRRFGGAGLGLAIAKSIVETHEGTITAHTSTELGGLRVRVALPRSREDS